VVGWRSGRVSASLDATVPIDGQCMISLGEVDPY